LFGYQVLCLDLDIMIVGSLNRIMDYRGLFCSRSNYFGKGNDRRAGGDIMSFKADKVSENMFWKPFIKNVKAAEEEVQGRERFWIWKCLGDKESDLFDDWAPGQILSYKIHHLAKLNHLPKEAAIVSCHGIPRPHQVTKSWAKQFWV
jgi:hypothetical protein